MSHDITIADHLVLTGKPAWHGLGTVVADAPTPQEALQIARLDWRVEQWPMVAELAGRRIDVFTHVLNVRSDTSKLLGVVGVDYKPVQNADLAEFVHRLGDSRDVEIESAGSLKGGRRVWFLARGESIWVNDADEVRPYLLVANGHDGTMAVVCQPTSIRVVCRNTLHMALTGKETDARQFRFRHEGNIADKLAQAKEALGLLKDAAGEFQRQITHLNASSMSREELMRFWLDVYSAAIGEVPAHPTTKEEVAKAEQCKRVLAQWAHNFDQDRQRLNLPASGWTALNAVTHWFDHQKTVRAPNDAIRRDNRQFNNWWGANAAAKQKALQMALTR